MADIVQAVKSNPKYHELVTSRRKFGYTLAAVMLVIYYGFILLIAFAPKFLGTPIAQGMTMTIGIPIGLGVIVSAFVLTGVYIWRANTVYDPIVQQIKEDVL
jgi:uncharacterized membrane protein (DUF485 family)